MDYQFLDRRLKTLSEESRLRTIPEIDSNGIDLCSNDYMGLGARFSEFIPEFSERFSDAAMSSSASRLLSSHRKYHKMLEDKLDSFYGRKSLLFNSGYHANVGLVQSLASAGATFICDKLVHASVIDGLRCGNAQFLRFKHNNPEDASKQLAKLASDAHPIIITESIFSMDGDEAPLEELRNVKREHPNAMLYVDEAHAFGVRGPQGTGIVAEKNLIDDVDIIVGTFGKAAASSGAFVNAPVSITDWLINTSRSFIFSTAIPPVNVAWTLLMIEKLSEMGREREHLIDISKRFRSAIEQITDEENPSRSQIVPMITHDSAKAITISKYLQENLINALPIRRPTVPPGGERIRFSLNALLQNQDIDKVISTLKKIFQC